MNLIDVLIQQHRDAEALFEAWRHAPDEEKPELCLRLAEALTMHSTIEERWVYPVARTVVDGPRIDFAVEEHGEMAQLLSELLRVRHDARRREATVRQLEAVVAQHMTEEEREILPRLRKMDSGAFGLSSAEIVRAASDARKEAMRQLETSAPM
ncbi:hemerythrin domain-containing protein [Corallococcus exiguus]|uniref:hemerythrin domain-containing protein n=1 Tax=Corallococcus TaxID=83461 RepID=UPI000EBF5A89|nr:MULTISPECIES: hemerythrin domain-containing protein [Corallococcus]NNB86554.1 hemerythrin domain-containing protein [Corallococcus exiguus]NNB92747.1 hemerythrin domain-containing protein [Corallococcus exiguus]NNC05886.1 hemerythrin domain-containing protein [Corallococcus exiguus]NPC49612.1 hemerythrin domain-containing protein [Corallococcus exiguus]RKH77921.1 hemerythrin domain-containing protein [Corallococcus sp. AB032C]